MEKEQHFGLKEALSLRGNFEHDVLSLQQSWEEKIDMLFEDFDRHV